MYKFLELSFPQKIIALVIVAIVIPLAVMLSFYFAQGTITVTVDKPEGYVVIGDERYDTPHTHMQRAGRLEIAIGASGYSEELKTITVPSFRTKKTYAFTLTKKDLYEESEDGTAEERFEKKYPWVKLLPYEETDFEIEYPEANGDLRVYLAPKLFVIPGVSSEDLTKGLSDAKKKAEAWFTSKKANLTDFTVQWLPYDPDTRR